MTVTHSEVVGEGNGGVTESFFPEQCVHKLHESFSKLCKSVIFSAGNKPQAASQDECCCAAQCFLTFHRYRPHVRCVFRTEVKLQNNIKPRPHGQASQSQKLSLIFNKRCDSKLQWRLYLVLHHLVCWLWQRFPRLMNPVSLSPLRTSGFHHYQQDSLSVKHMISH